MLCFYIHYYKHFFQMLKVDIDVERPVDVGCFHRYSKKNRYQQVKIQDGGGTKKLMLKNADMDSVDKVIQAAVKSFKPESDKLQRLTNSSEIRLGLCKEKKFFSEI